MLLGGASDFGSVVRSSSLAGSVVVAAAVVRGGARMEGDGGEASRAGVGGGKYSAKAIGQFQGDRSSE